MFGVRLGSNRNFKSTRSWLLWGEQKMNLHYVGKGSPQPARCVLPPMSPVSSWKNCSASQKVIRSRLILPALIPESWDGNRLYCSTRISCQVIHKKGGIYVGKAKSKWYLLTFHCFPSMNNYPESCLNSHDVRKQHYCATECTQPVIFFFLTLFLTGVKKPNLSY